MSRPSGPLGPAHRPNTYQVGIQDRWRRRPGRAPVRCGTDWIAIRGGCHIVARFPTRDECEAHIAAIVAAGAGAWR